MTKFSEQDLDRAWSSDEVYKLSDRELTTLAFLRDRKNFFFFFPQAVVLYFAARHLGIFGLVVGWIGIVLFSLFVVQNAFQLLLGTFVVATSLFVKDKSKISSFRWKALAVLLSMANTVVYILAALIVWAGIYGLALY
jgi:hypothetical protein